MLSFVVRFAKRFGVLVPGIAIAYVSIKEIFPVFDKRLPLALAIFLTYVIGAYVLIPALLRFYRLVIPARHLPTYCVTPDGFACDPLNIGVIGNKAQLISAMTKAGWHVADQKSPRNLLKQGLWMVIGKTYTTAPMSSLFLFGRQQDIGFEIPIEGKFGHRHHVRFWATTYEVGKPLSKDSIHWIPRRLAHPDMTLLWLGAATRDVGFGLIRHNVQISHMIHPDSDRERDMIAAQLTKNRPGKLTSIKLNDPYRLVNRVWRGYFLADGRLTVVKL